MRSCCKIYHCGHLGHPNPSPPPPSICNRVNDCLSKPNRQYLALLRGYQHLVSKNYNPPFPSKKNQIKLLPPQKEVGDTYSNCTQ